MLVEGVSLANDRVTAKIVFRLIAEWRGPAAPHPQVETGGMEASDSLNATKTAEALCVYTGE